MTAKVGRLGGGRIEQKGKKDLWTEQQWWLWGGEGGVRGLNGNGKNTMKINFKKVWACTVLGAV